MVLPSKLPCLGVILKSFCFLSSHLQVTQWYLISTLRCLLAGTACKWWDFPQKNWPQMSRPDPIRSSNQPTNQWPFQEPKLEVPTTYEAYIRHHRTNRPTNRPTDRPTNHFAGSSSHRRCLRNLMLLHWTAMRVTQRVVTVATAEDGKDGTGEQIQALEAEISRLQEQHIGGQVGQLGQVDEWNSC